MSRQDAQECSRTVSVNLNINPILDRIILCLGLPRLFSGKESVCQCRRSRFNPWVGKIPWRRKWQPTLLFFPGEFHGQRSLGGYSPGVAKELNMHILCCGAEEGLFLHWRMFRNIHVLYLDFPGGSDGKDSACSVGDLGSIRSLGWEDSLEEGMVTHSSILA